MKTITLELSPSLRIHGLRSGTVAVKKSHYAWHGPDGLGFPALLADWRWTAPLPVHCWVIEHPDGIFLIDTGENRQALQAPYFASKDPQSHVSGQISRRILRLDLAEDEELPGLLAAVGLSPGQIQAVVLTHLHLDHTDGLKFVPQAEVLVSRTEWTRPYGWVPHTLPKGFTPSLVAYQPDHNLPFGRSFRLAHNLWVVPTPGHTHGHQSVLLEHGNVLFCFAGDCAFSQAQWQAGEVAGICVDPATARHTYAHLHALAGETRLVFLPSHDAGAFERLAMG